MKNAYLAFFLVLIACGKTPRTSIVGSWSGTSVTILSEHSEESIQVPIEKYGDMTLLMNRDSSYTFAIAVLKDVRVEKKVFGMEASKVLVPAVYRSAWFGKWFIQDSVFVLSSNKGRIFAQLSPIGEELKLNFTDAEGRKWLCILEPKD